MRSGKNILSQETADHILKLINTQFSEGDKIPNEMELSEQLDVSRTTVREAIKLLCAINVLEIRRGSGTFVCHNPGVLKDPLGYRFIEKDKLIADLFETRLIFEPEIAALAAVKATPEAIGKIQEALARHNEDIEKVKRGSISKELLFQSDLDFHKAITDACDNLVLGRIMPIITHGLMEIYYGKVPFQLKARSHNTLFEAIAGKEPDQARDVMRQHLKAALYYQVQKDESDS